MRLTPDGREQEEASEDKILLRSPSPRLQRAGAGATVGVDDVAIVLRCCSIPARHGQQRFWLKRRAAH
jgi:hypothetical protein